MSYLLKDLYSPAFYDKFADYVIEVLPSFEKQKFTRLIFDDTWESRELKDRMRHTARVLHHFLPEDFEKTAPLLVKTVAHLQQNEFTGASLEFMFFPEYIATYGIHHFDASVKAMEYITQFTSCEFAVRPFILRYGDQMLDQMCRWTQHENHHVRRLASEGSRPRLPWAMALPALKKDPTPILPLLENLKTDPSEYVRRSVANSLNDIAKDNPDIVLSIAEKWKGLGKETEAIIKHGSRTLLKQGHPGILKYYGLQDSSHLEISDFAISKPSLHIGEYLVFSFTIQNKGAHAATARLEYGVYYLRQNGTHAKKVFKISERQLQPGEQSDLQRKQSFKVITTRRFYPGQHQLSIIVNGQEREIRKFELHEAP
jgi:3-methyladenine DNA glycosylase AlkC